jgi:outer membrane lipopolysaccharide assembly protein LptE/RlpB
VRQSRGEGPGLRASAWLLLLALGLGPVALAGCGYSLAGRGSFLPDTIKTIGIPQFVNQTTIFDLDRVVTQQVQREFASHGRYKIVPERTGADAVVIGTLRSWNATPSAFSNGQVTRYTLTITASVEFRDVKEDKVIWQSPALQFREEYDLPPSGGTTDVAAYFNQNQGALGRIAQNFAKTVVTSILEAF